jgi:hypothetical protein
MAITLDRARKWDLPIERLLVPFDDDPLCQINLESEDHLRLIEQLICKYKTPLVVVDSLRGGHDGDENSSRVGRVLQSLAAIAERTKAAILIVHHTKKLGTDEEITANSSRGSNAILAMMRSQIGIDRPDPGSKWCRMQVLKENLGLAPQPVGFLVTDNGLEFGAPPERPRKDTRKQDAIDWLKATMTPGWHLARDIHAKAKQAEFSENALQRAREDLGVTTATGCVRQRKDGLYEWCLPMEGQKSEEEGRPSPSAREYDTEWRNFRNLYAQLAAPVCVDCQYHGTSEEMDLDHIVPLREGGAKFDSKNLAWRCGQRSGNGCHRRKTAAENKQ